MKKYTLKEFLNLSDGLLSCEIQIDKNYKYFLLFAASIYDDYLILNCNSYKNKYYIEINMNTNKILKSNFNIKNARFYFSLNKKDEVFDKNSFNYLKLNSSEIKSDHIIPEYIFEYSINKIINSITNCSITANYATNFTSIYCYTNNILNNRFVFKFIEYEKLDNAISNLIFV
jgi:hypothetical protein